MSSKIDQEVIDELIAMLEEHIGSGLGPKKDEMVPEAAAEEVPGVEPEMEAAEPAEDDDEDMKKLMEMYSRG